MDRSQANEKAETESLISEARQLGIEIPKNPAWWRKDLENFLTEDYWRLTETGKTALKKLIKDERRRELEWRQRDLECKLKIVECIITALTTLAGFLMLISSSR